jgi:hypothetical protein
LKIIFAGHVKDSTPEFEAVEQQLATEEKHKTREQQPITKKSAVVMTPEKAKHAKMEMDFDFPNHPEESFTHNSVRSDIMGRSLAVNYVVLKFVMLHIDRKIFYKVFINFF